MNKNEVIVLFWTKTSERKSSYFFEQKTTYIWNFGINSIEMSDHGLCLRWDSGQYGHNYPITKIVSVVSGSLPAKVGDRVVALWDKSSRRYSAEVITCTCLLHLLDWKKLLGSGRKAKTELSEKRRQANLAVAQVISYNSRPYGIFTHSFWALFPR